MLWKHCNFDEPVIFLSTNDCFHLNIDKPFMIQDNAKCQPQLHTIVQSECLTQTKLILLLTDCFPQCVSTSFSHIFLFMLHLDTGATFVYFIWSLLILKAVYWFLVVAIGGRPKPEICFLLGQLGWMPLPKERYSNSLSGRGSNTQPFNWEADTLPLSSCLPFVKQPIWFQPAPWLLHCFSYTVQPISLTFKAWPQYQNIFHCW